MSYTSFGFLIFVCITMLIYFLFPIKKYQWVILLLGSYAFYLFAGFKAVGFILFTTFTTYLSAILIDSSIKKQKAVIKAHKADWDRVQKKAYKAKVKVKMRLILIGMVVINLGILAFLKYYNFLAGNLNDLLHAGGSSFSAPTLKLLLPLGISFYTFQSVGYVVDVYNEKIKAERNLAKVALFVSFFPQIIQGPISFYDQLAGQLYEPHCFDFTRFKHGCELILWGLFKKMVIADRAIIAINTVLDSYFDYNGTTLTFMVLLYALQLYTDFSGGIDISRGVAQVFGIELVQNFKRPYFATTINGYWRRWHISLGAWMKEYVFYPLALSKTFTNISKKLSASKFGSRKFGAHVAKVLPSSIASLVVFFLVGVWHGANWKYIGFGIWNGGIIMLSTLLEPLFAQTASKLHINVKSFGFRIFQMFRTFLVVLIGYVFDVAPDFSAAMYTFKQVLVAQELSEGFKQIAELGLNIVDYCSLTLCTILLFCISTIQERHSDTSIRLMLDRKPFIWRYALLFVGILYMLVFAVYGPGFDPVQFVYMQF